ncbi:hypothetical protein GCM10027028_05460 [Streptomyces sundarbansensis]
MSDLRAQVGLLSKQIYLETQPPANPAAVTAAAFTLTQCTRVAHPPTAPSPQQHLLGMAQPLTPERPPDDEGRPTRSTAGRTAFTEHVRR